MSKNMSRYLLTLSILSMVSLLNICLITVVCVCVSVCLSLVFVKLEVESVWNSGSENRSNPDPGEFTETGGTVFSLVFGTHRRWLRSINHSHQFICRIKISHCGNFILVYFIVATKPTGLCGPPASYCLLLTPLHCHFLHIAMRTTGVPGCVANVKRFLPLLGVYWQCQEANGSRGRQEEEIHMASHERRQSTRGWKTTHTQQARGLALFSRSNQAR